MRVKIERVLFLAPGQRLSDSGARASCARSSKSRSYRIFYFNLLNTANFSFLKREAAANGRVFAAKLRAQN